MFVGSLAADTIELKSGVIYKGKVISQDENSYLIKIKESNSITDERRIPKKEIKAIIAEAKDHTDFIIIKSLIPTPDMLTAKSYSNRIKFTSTFLKKYPKSKYLKEVKAILETLEQENAQLSTGGLKLDGQIISQSDIEANVYDIDARILAHKMKNLAKSGNYRKALRQWENLENNYSHSESYKDNLTLASRILKAHQSELEKNLDTLEDRLKQQEAVLKSLNDNDRKRTEQILAEKKIRSEFIMAKEKNTLKTKWFTIDPFNKEANDNNLRNATSALQSLKKLDPSTIKLAGSDYRAAWSALAKDDLKEADKRINALKSFKIPEKYTEPLIQQLKEKQANQAEEQKAAKEKEAAEKKAAVEAAKEASKKTKKRRK